MKSGGEETVVNTIGIAAVGIVLVIGSVLTFFLWKRFRKGNKVLIHLYDAKNRTAQVKRLPYRDGAVIYKPKNGEPLRAPLDGAMSWDSEKGKIWCLEANTGAILTPPEGDWIPKQTATLFGQEVHWQADGKALYREWSSQSLKQLLESSGMWDTIKKIGVPALIILFIFLMALLYLSFKILGQVGGAAGA